ncbi:response regulator [Novosphingobium sp. PS1R-30]|uniref:Response regulator n=1 Tax=Novosphingobium anseongense TaxID=3133436 RepID=A0ABU8RY34_9SPHN|nr:MAG: response regulator [Novosphingobium sp.]
MITEPLILVVDDDPAIRTGLSNLLRSAGYVVALAKSAEDFLADPPAVAPACVITDIQMPGLSGFELQAILAEMWPALPVIVMTAFPEPAVRDRALGAGAICFLAKPFDAEELLGCVERALV